MTKSFDTLLLELMPAELGIGAPAMAKKIAKKAADAPMTGHWKAIKRLPETENAILEIMKAVFPEKHPKTGKVFSYSSMIDNKEDLKAEILKAIQNVTQKKGYAEKFAADRVTTATLEETIFELANEVMKKNEPVTQKEVRQKLNKKLAAKPAAETESEAVYYRAASLDPDYENLSKAFNKIPEEGNIKWSQIVSKVGEENATALKRAGAIIEVIGAEEEPDEEKEIPALDVMGDDDEDIASNFDRFIDPYMRDTRGSFSKYHGDY